MNDFLLKHGNELKTLMYAVFIYLQIDTNVVNTLLLLMAIDTCTGILKAIALKQPVMFQVLFFGLITKLVVLLIPMTVALVGKGLEYDFRPLVDVVLKVLVVAEGWSILTNFYVMRTKKEIENPDIVTMLLNAIRKFFMNLLKMFLMKIETADDVFKDKPEDKI